MKKIYFLFAMALTAFVANAQSPVTIENGDFSLPANATKYTTLSAHAIPGWNSDDATADNNGREASYVAYMKNTGGSIYNVLAEVIPTTETTYQLTFDGWLVYNPEAPSEVDFVVTFSSLASGAASTERVPIQTVTIKLGVDPNSAQITIPAAAAYAGKNLVIEIDCNTPSVTNTNTWVGYDTFALTRTNVTTSVKNTESISFRTYPNPFKDNLKVESTDVIKSVSIYSVNGQRIKDVTVNSTKANIGTSNLSKGAYILKVESANGSKTMSIVK